MSSNDKKYDIVLHLTDKELDDLQILGKMISKRNRTRVPADSITAKIIFNQGLRHYKNKIDSYREYLDDRFMSHVE